MAKRTPIDALPPSGKRGRALHAVIETPQGSRNKYKFDPDLGVFRLSKVLPAGAVFPFSFGFIPQTLSEDGDPLDVLVVCDEPVPVGCMVECRLIGVLEAEQGGDGTRERNDRLLAVADASVDHADLRSVREINAALKLEIEHFFVSYHEVRGEKFRVLAWRGPSPARRAVKKAATQFRRRAKGERGRV